MKKRKRFDFGFRKVCRTLRKMRRRRWRAFLLVGEWCDELRFCSPSGSCVCPEKAILIFSGGPTNTPSESYDDVRERIAPALNQHPATAMSVALASDNVWEYLGDRTHYTMNFRRRRALFEACGLDPKLA